MESAKMRAAAASAFITLGIAAAPLVAAFTVPVSGGLGKVSWSFTLSALPVLAVVTALMGAFGTHATVAAHPRAVLGQVSHTVHYWMPAAVLSGVAAVAVLRAPSSTALLAALLPFGLLLSLVFLLEYQTVAPDLPAYAQARWVLSTLDYGIALATFLLLTILVSGAKVQAGLIGLSGGLLALDLLRQPMRTPDRVAAFVILIGGVVGFAASRLSMWDLSPIKTAVLLLLVLYALTGAVQQQLRGRLTWLTSLEYLALLVLGSWAALQLLP